MKFTLQSAVGAAAGVIVKDPEPATTATDFSVVSLLATVAIMMEVVVQRLSVTVKSADDAAAIITCPEVLFIVVLPVVPLIVFPRERPLNIETAALDVI